MTLSKILKNAVNSLEIGLANYDNSTYHPKDQKEKRQRLLSRYSLHVVAGFPAGFRLDDGLFNRT